MVSIGIPETGKKFVRHLELANGGDYVYVDPKNVLYDALDMNRGIKETFMTPSTPYSFLDRMMKKSGMDDLMTIMKKWNKGIYLPPEIEQAFIQGGTFVFHGSRTVLSHYDESTAAHADVETVVNVALNEAENAKSSVKV